MHNITKWRSSGPTSRKWLDYLDHIRLFDKSTAQDRKFAVAVTKLYVTLNGIGDDEDYVYDGREEYEYVG